MNPILPPGEMLRRALTWIVDERTAKPDTPLGSLVEDAAVRFDLSPAQEEWLLHTLHTLREAPLAGSAPIR
jgi:hypothetical protein